MDNSSGHMGTFFVSVIVPKVPIVLKHHNTTFRYIGEIKTRSADLNFMEVGSLSNILAKFNKHKIQIRDIGRFCLI